MQVHRLIVKAKDGAFLILLKSLRLAFESLDW